MKTVIYLIRHGQTNWNALTKIQGRINIPLNDDGKSQLLQSAKLLSSMHINIDEYYSSPLQRAIESCQIIKNYLHDDQKIIKTKNDLIEREFGVADGLIINDEVYAKILDDQYENMETSSMIEERATKAIEKIMKENLGKTILILTHSHFIKAFFKTIDPNITFKTNLKNGGICYIIWENDKIIDYQFNIYQKSQLIN